MITNPNQGFDPDHRNSPLFPILRQFGLWYSHTTMVTYLDGSKRPHDTYIQIGTDWVIGVSMRPAFRIECHKLGSGRTTIRQGSAIIPYLRRKFRLTKTV